MNCTPESLAAKDLAVRKGMGQHVPDEIFQGEPLGTQFAYAKVDNIARNEFAGKLVERSNEKLSTMGAVKSWVTILRDPQATLGDAYTRSLLDALQKHWVETQGKDAEAFKRDISPVIDQMRADLQDHHQEAGKISFANDWLDYWQNGGRLYRPVAQDAGLARKIGNVLMYPVKTLMENTVVNNPFIAGAHTFQVAPKAVAIYGPQAAIKGAIDFASRIGEHKIFGEDPELAAKGLYRGHERGFNLVTFGDNAAKGLAYRIAEAAGKDGLDGVQNIAYQYRLGREPMVMWHTENAAQVYLMRFAIESTKMYGGWLRNVAQGAATGNVKMAASGAGALAAFSITQSLMTGVKSAIPAPVYAFLDDDTKALVDEWDKSPFLNIAGHVTGRDIAEHYQPMGGFGLGVAQGITTSDFKTGFSKFPKAKEDFAEGDYMRAGVDFTRGFTTMGQAAIPGMRTTYKKLFDVVGDALTGDSEWSDVPEEAAKKLGFPAMDLAK